MAKYRFTKRLRLLRPGEFERVFATRVSASDAILTVHAAVNELGHPRLGLIVSRKVGGAVVRNLWKRSLRQAFRLSQHELPAMDLICIPRAATVPASAELRASLLGLSRKSERRRSSRVNSASDSQAPSVGNSE